jgi:DNA-binding NtrC family response regulator
MIGPVRELEAVMERVSILTPHQVIRETDIARELRTFKRAHGGSDASFTLPSGGVVFEDVEHHLLKQAMDRAEGNMTEAAKLLGMSYRTFRYRALKFGIMEK